MSSQSQLHIIVIGAGLSGLTASVALRRAGHVVTIYERSAMARELGQGIVIAPNAGRILESLGFDFVRARNSAMMGRQVVDRKTLERLVPDVDYRKIPELQETPMRTAYRPDLHQELLRLATEGAGKGVPVRIHSGSTVTAIDADKGTVNLASGIVTKGDFVVAADGIHSQAASTIFAPHTPPKLEPSPIRVYRFSLSAELLRADAELQPLLAIDDMRAHIAVSADKRSWLIWYWCRDQDICSFGYYTLEDSNSELHSSEHSIRSQVDCKELQRKLADFHPAIIRVAGLSKEILPAWRCTSRAPITKFHKGRLVAIGDAAHPVLPHIGLGAVSGIEDAGCLGALFMNSPAEGFVLEAIKARLELFSKLRVSRTAVYKVYSDIPMFDDGAVELQHQEALQWLQPEYLPGSQADLIPWYTRYDVVKDTKRELHLHGLDGYKASLPS